MSKSHGRHRVAESLGQRDGVEHDQVLDPQPDGAKPSTEKGQAGSHPTGEPPPPTSGGGVRT
jgi:hypothetical protein